VLTIGTWLLSQNSYTKEEPPPVAPFTGHIDNLVPFSFISTDVLGLTCVTHYWTLLKSTNKKNSIQNNVKRTNLTTKIDIITINNSYRLI
jgi:hypothetical protein